jgi:hypothetical protein
MKLATTLGCEYIDLKITWLSVVTESILVAKE